MASVNLKELILDALKAAKDYEVHRNDAIIQLTLSLEGVWIALSRGKNGQWDRLITWHTLELSNLPNVLITEMQNMMDQIDAILPT